MTAFNARQDFTPLGSIFIALSCSFIVLCWRRGFFFSFLMKRLSVMVQLLQHKILPKTWPWTNFAQGQFTPEFERKCKPSHSSQRRKLFWVYKIGVILKFIHGATALNALSLWFQLNHFSPTVTLLNSITLIWIFNVVRFRIFLKMCCLKKLKVLSALSNDAVLKHTP